MLLRFTGLYAKEMEIETINFGCNNTEAASKLNTVLNTIEPNFDLFLPHEENKMLSTLQKYEFWQFIFPILCHIKASWTFGYTVWKWGNFGVVTATLQNIKEVGGIKMSELKSYQQRCLKHNVKLALFRLCAAAGSPKETEIIHRLLFNNSLVQLYSTNPIYILISKTLLT